MTLPKTSLIGAPTVSTEVALVDNTNRTPSTTRPVLVFILVYGTIQQSGSGTAIATVGATVYDTATTRNYDAVSLQASTLSLCFIVPANTAYKVDWNGGGSLAGIAYEQVL